MTKSSYPNVAFTLNWEKQYSIFQAVVVGRNSLLHGTLTFCKTFRTSADQCIRFRTLACALSRPED